MRDRLLALLMERVSDKDLLDEVQRRRRLRWLTYPISDRDYWNETRVLSEADERALWASRG